MKVLLMAQKQLGINKWGFIQSAHKLPSLSSCKIFKLKKIKIKKKAYYKPEEGKKNTGRHQKPKGGEGIQNFF